MQDKRTAVRLVTASGDLIGYDKELRPVYGALLR